MTMEKEIEIFHRSVDDFLEKYRPKTERDGHYFYVELQTLLSRATILAQRPFIKELDIYRDAALDRALLAKIPPKDFS